MNYKKTYTPKNGYTPLCEIGKCSLKDLEFGILELSDGQSYTYETKDREVAFIILGGKANFTANGKDYGMVGARRNVFENPKAECFYAPRNCSVKIDSPWNIKIAVCSTPIDVDSEPQAIHQADVRVVRLGVKPWERDTSFIMDGSTNAKKLTIGEAYITPGNWAGFPPHKHDVDNMPSEGVLEEIYYFLFDPQQGFGVQCLYTSDGEIDEAYRVKNDELVEFPRGYHTTVGAPGYNTYFLWLMAGKDQGFYRSNDPDHEWVSAVENLVKKQG
ncbi:MAG: 5-deoxy-glucuronate isomerase [Candidatus Limiplasma sp.]|nr:5-deoxy-glucuronate isomerase [Candidatus Limiplasma sp.]